MSGRPDLKNVETLIVAQVERITAQVMRIDFSRSSGDPLPVWAPGAHVDVHLPSGLIRQYSLCGDPQDATRYRIAVLREEQGRGGSCELCDLVAPGLSLRLGHPKNHFPLLPANEYLFVAGGIGITPILPMLHEASRRGAPWTLIYCGRSRSTMAFIDELSQIPGGTLTVMSQEEVGMPDLNALLCNVADCAEIYCCGPTGMLDAAVESAARLGKSRRLHIERFAAPGDVQVEQTLDTAFEVELARSGRVLTVPADRRLGDVLVDAGIPISFSCSEGYCGTCETRVLSGLCDHRDTVLSEEERALGQYIMVCVSRAKSPRLVLDV